MGFELFGHVALVAESGGEGDFSEGEGGVGEEPADFAEALVEDVLDGGSAEGGFEGGEEPVDGHFVEIGEVFSMVVRARIALMRRAGKIFQQIVDELNPESFFTPSGTGAWNLGSVYKATRRSSVWASLQIQSIRGQRC